MSEKKNGSKNNLILLLGIGGAVALIIIFLIVIGSILVIGIIFGSDSDKNDSMFIAANNYNGLSLNCGIPEWTEKFNDAIKQVEEEAEIPLSVSISSSSFVLDDTDYDPTDAYIVRYVHSENFIANDDLAISLYVDADTEKIVKCEVVYIPYQGNDLTRILLNSVIPSIMATANVDFDTARTIVSEKVTQSGTYYDDNLFYQYTSTSTYCSFTIQAVAQDTYDEKYAKLLG